MTRGVTPRACFACGGTAADGAVLPARKRRERPLLCADCAQWSPSHLAALIERRRQEMALHPGSRQSRRSYRAAYRHRAASAQLDLVDLLRPPP